MSDPRGPPSTAEKDMKMNNVETQHELIQKYKIHKHKMRIYYAGIRPDGPLCRRHSETIFEYIIRRRRWHEMLMGLDPTFSISQDMLSMYLVDFANISEQEKMSVLAWAGESMNFETTAEHLQRICLYSHLRDIADGVIVPTHISTGVAAKLSAHASDRADRLAHWSRLVLKLVGVPQWRGDWNW